MKQAIVIFSFVVATACATRGQVTAPATGGTQVGTGATGGGAAGIGGTVGGGLAADRTPVLIPPNTPPLIPPNQPVLPPPTPPGANQIPGQISPPLTRPGTPVPAPPGVSPVNPAINPTVPGTLPPRVVAPNRGDVPGTSRRTTVPPTLLPHRSNITPAQHAQINRLATELAMFRNGAQLGVQQRNQLMNALTAAGNTATPVAQARLGPLADNLVLALSGLNLTPQQRHQLAIDLNMVLHSGMLAPSDTQIVIEDARNLLQTAGVNAEAVNLLTAELAAIARDLQPGSAATTSSPVPTQP